MKECCQWWNAIRGINRPAPRGDEWDEAMNRVKRQHDKRKRKPPKRNVTRNVATWYQAIRRIWAKHLDAVRRRGNPWEMAIERCVNQSKVRHSIKRGRNIGHAICPTCRRVPAWIRRCLGQHKREVSRASKGEWERKMDSISRGVGMRPKSLQRVRQTQQQGNWDEGMRRAIYLLNARQYWRKADEWSKWAVNAGTNIKRRARRRKDKQQVIASPA